MANDESTIATKTCRICKETKPENAFRLHPNKYNPLLRNLDCKTCENKRRYQRYLRDTTPEERRAKARMYTRKSYQKHREKRVAEVIAYHQENKVSYNAYMRAYNKRPLVNNKKKKLLKNWGENHKQEKQQYNKQYRINNPEIITTTKLRRRFRKKSVAINDLSAQQWREIKNAFGHRCAYCGKRQKRLTIDHVTPYFHNGDNTLWNVVPACRSCNSHKRTGPPLRAVQPLLLTVAPAKKPLA